MKRSLCFLIVLVMAAFLFVGTVSAGGKKETGKDQFTTIRVAYHPHIVGLGTMLIAEEKGYFAEEKLKVELVQFTAGPPELAAMASGDIDIGYLGVGAHVFGPKGQAKMIAMDSTDISNEIIATKSSGVTSLNDLVGKTVVVPAGTTADMVFAIAMEREGIDPGSVNVINMDVSGAVAAFIADKVDAIAIWEPFLNEIRKQKGEMNVIRLLHTSEFVPEYVFPQSWVVTNKFEKDNGDVIVRFLKAWIRANDYRYENMNECVSMTANYLNQDVSSTAVLVEATNWLNSEMLKQMYTDGTALEWYGIQQQIFVNAGKLDEFVPVENFVGTKYLLEAFKALGM